MFDEGSATSSEVRSVAMAVAPRRRISQEEDSRSCIANEPHQVRMAKAEGPLTPTTTVEGSASSGFWK